MTQSIDLSKLSESIDSITTESSFSSLNEHRQHIKDKQLSYEDLLDYATCCRADLELYEFENNALRSLLKFQEALVSVYEEANKIRETNLKEVLEISEFQKLVATTRRYLEGHGRGRATQKTVHGATAANARHAKPGGSREKQQKIRELWASGKYSSRDVCAEQECAALGMSFSTARRALRGTPDPPSRCV